MVEETNECYFIYVKPWRIFKIDEPCVYRFDGYWEGDMCLNIDLQVEVCRMIETMGSFADLQHCDLSAT